MCLFHYIHNCNDYLDYVVIDYLHVEADTYTEIPSLAVSEKAMRRLLFRLADAKL